MTYGIFILVNGAWKLHDISPSKTYAMQEKDYLVTMLGLKAEIFQRNNRSDAHAED